MRPVLILRPEPGASATAERAAALGLEVRRYPLFAAAAVPWTMPDGAFDALLLTSATAVRLAGTLPNLPVHAVGEATAATAKMAGLQVMSVGSGGVAELLAALPPDLRLLHLAGEERIVPAEARQTITSVIVYRMELLGLPAPATIEGTVTLVHSPAAGRRLAGIAADRRAIRIAAISPAAVSACGSGWDRCEAVEQPNDAALLSLAAKLCETERP